METIMQGRTETDRTMWFSMWFLASIATFGVAFFPMFYRLIDSRNKHFRREANLESQIADFLRAQGKEPPATVGSPRDMNAKALAASIILIIPAFIIVYYLSRDLRSHEEHQDLFLASAFPERMFMPQTLPIKKYALITIVTLGVGGIYWLYKIINLYNTHFKVQGEIGRELARLMEEKTVGESV
jgi:phosphoglycerol transferase MdoB-like AlkP superfamily enzyme